MSATTGPAAPDVIVTVCRGCCCGSVTKHPNTDHDGQRLLLGTLDPGSARVRVVDCIDRCARSNVILVREHLGPGRRRDTWFGGVHYRADTEELVAWVAAGCPVLPPDLARLRIGPPPRS